MTIHPRLLHKLETISVQSSRAAESTQNDPTIPVILYYCRPHEEVRQCILRRYGPIKYELPFINAMALDLPPEKVKLIAKERMVQWITEDVAVSKVGEERATGNPRRPPARRIPLPTRPMPERRRPGRPAAVAVIDTGVAPHPDLLRPTNRIRAFCDLIHEKPEPYDDDGHGTHIAGILSGLASWPGQEKSGGRLAAAVAAEHSWSPDIVAIKALDEEGDGTASDILAAMQWTVNHRRHFNIRVVNLSLGVSADHEDDSDPLVRGVEALTRFGLCVVAAAGNSGPKPHTISSPGISPYAITVGAHDGTHVASFSSRGPVPGGRKPDLVAPGVDILSLTNDSAGYVRQSGTSMAAPFVSRAVAGLYQDYPFAGPLLIKELLLSRTIPLNDETPDAQGRGALVP
ncbi:MAG: S8 family peptidase [Firmicutes bacterium]|nr:S8 family peptidase [Bacillota bacterium]